jgi:hypothetical protein
VTCSAADAAGNKTTRRFTVTVGKHAQPTATCSSKRIVTIHIPGRWRGRRVTSAKGIVLGRKVRALRGPRGYSITVDMRGLGKMTLPVELTLNHGSRQKSKLERVFHPCQPGEKAGR